MTRNPKMRPRFMDRLQEYQNDWDRLLQCLHGPLFVHLRMSEFLAEKPRFVAKESEVDEGLPIGAYRNGMIRLM